VPLSDVQIRSLKPRDRIYKISDANSLYLEVHPTGARLWRFKYSWHGKQKRIALGAYPNVGLAEARRKRDETRLLIHDGVDPLADRKRQKLVGKYKASNRFGDLAGEYIEMVTKEGRSEATIEKMKWLLEKLRPIADTPVADLQAVDLFAVLKKIEAQGRFETARRCRSFASRVFRYAAASGRADLRLLRHTILHNKGILKASDHKKLMAVADLFRPDGVVSLPNETIHRLFFLVKKAVARLVLTDTGAAGSAPYDVSDINEIAIQRV